MTTAYDRALAAEPQLCAVEHIVDQLCERARPDDYERYGHVWVSVVKALVSPLVGDERGLIPRQAPDGPAARIATGADFIFGEYTAPASETEEWLRGPEAFTAVMVELQRRLAEAGSPGE
jgi:hypothetical protein